MIKIIKDILINMIYKEFQILREFYYLNKKFRKWLILKFKMEKCSFISLWIL
jgi:hypothetical protein